MGYASQEMVESRKVVKFTADVIDTNGAKVPTEVVRVGLFNIVADGKYLNYSPETKNVTEIPRRQKVKDLLVALQTYLIHQMKRLLWFGPNIRRGSSLISSKT